MIESITEYLQSISEIKAAWLGGSYGRGDQDAFSDYDFFVYSEDAETVFKRICTDITKRPDVIFTKTLPFGMTLNSITEDWERFDISFVDDNALPHHGHNTSRILFDRGDIASRMPKEATSTRPDPKAELQSATREFVRILGLLIVVAGREDYMIAQKGVQVMKDLLMQIMVLRADKPVRGVPSVRKALLPEDYDFLLNAPPVAATRESILALNAYLAPEFLKHARVLYAEHGLQWPERFVAATLKNVKNKTGLQIIT